jgi:hypothetical protein
MRSPLASVGQSRETWPTSPPIRELVADPIYMEFRYTDSCSTSVLGCSHGPCGRNRHTSSRSADDHRGRRGLRNRHRSHRRNRHCRSYHLGSSYAQCGRPVRTCSTPGCHHRCSCCRRPGGIRGKGDRSVRNGSKTSPWGPPDIHGLQERSVKYVGMRVSIPTYSSDPGL